MGDYIIYAHDERTDSRNAYEVPTEATIQYFLEEVLMNTTNKVIFEEVVLNDLNPDQTLADIGLCPECTVIISIYITYDAFDKILRNFMNDLFKFDKYVYNHNTSYETDNLLWNYIKDVDDIDKFFDDNNANNKEIINTFMDEYTSYYGYDQPESKWWYWDIISTIDDLPVEFIKKYINKLNVSHLSHHPNLTFDIVLDNMDKKWCWISLTQHSNITFDMVLKYPDLPWCPDRLSLNPNITADIMANNPEYPWHYAGFIFNINLTMDWIIQNKHILSKISTFEQRQICFNEFRLDRIRLCGN